MADSADEAADLHELVMSISIANTKVKVFTRPHTGNCYNCYQSISDGGFCDTDCRDDFEMRNR